MVRSLTAQRLDPEYIRHYLQESYQLGNAQIDEVFAALNVGKKRSANIKSPNMGGKTASPRREFRP